MAIEDESREYMSLFSRRKEGNYLYQPLNYEQLHPGSIGFFDSDNHWNEITDVSDPEKLREKGFASLDRSLSDLFRDECNWNTRSAESDSERGYQGKAGASGAASGVPAEASGELKYKVGSKGKAALIADGLVKVEKYMFPFGPPIQNWVKENGDKLVEYCGDAAEKYGIWAVQSVWITDACAVTMTSSSNRDIDAALEVGATGLGKLGGGASFLEKLSNEGWTTYPAQPGSKGRVVSFNGVKYKPRKLTKWFRSSPFKQVEAMASASETPRALRPMYDDQGNLTGFELVERVANSEGGLEFKKVEEKEEENDNEETAEGEGFALEMNDVECDGMSEEDIEAEKRYQEEQKAKNDQEMIKEWEEFVKETEEISKARKERLNSLRAQIEAIRAEKAGSDH